MTMPSTIDRDDDVSTSLFLGQYAVARFIAFEPSLIQLTSAASTGVHTFFRSTLVLPWLTSRRVFSEKMELRKSRIQTLLLAPMDVEGQNS
ncbi:hypothetical protein TIFTF001_030373 [Ficus carica]|uniref:Uncharacterized protein n=1 Tax=Ficus carica TaxID=3494 RepID=A0AA88DTE4_FICCA|nr:hypothetical protein TIFTF001_030373 [Ficus carica]